MYGANPQILRKVALLPNIQILTQSQDKFKKRDRETWLKKKSQAKNPENTPNEMEIYELPNRELKITIIKMLITPNVFRIMHEN